MEVKTLRDAATALETGEIRLIEAIDLLSLIFDDLEENDTRSEEGRLILAHRCKRYLNSMDILRRDLDSIREEMHESSDACYAADKKDRETVERVKLTAARIELSELASGKNGVDICPIFREMGYNTLRDVPPEKLEMVLDRVRQEARKARESAED